MALKLKNGPTITPVTLDEAKAHCRIDTTDDDIYILGLIEQATSMLDGPYGRLGLCLLEQSWELSYDAFPTTELKIPLGNLISVTSVEYVDPISKTLTVWPALNNYEVDAASEEGWIIPVNAWPAVAATSNAIKIIFKAGYGATADKVPPILRRAILLLIGDWYENREATVLGQTVSEMPHAVTTIVNMYARGRVF
jgi:uncharacterized phiE125 gp8 family phage protein